MDSFKIKLASNATAKFFGAVHSAHLQIFSRFKWIWMGNGGCNFGYIQPPMWQNGRGKIYVFWHRIFTLVRILLFGTRSVPLNSWYCGSYDHAHSRETQSRFYCVTQSYCGHNFYCSKSVSQNEKVEMHLGNERSGLAFSRTDSGHVFGSNVGNNFGIVLRRKRPHKPVFVYYLVCIQFPMMYSVGDTKAPLLRWFPFISKMTTGDNLTTGQYMNYPTFSNLQLRPLLKNSFDNVRIDLKKQEVKRYLSCL